MTDQTKEVIFHKRSELTDEQIAIGWDYVFWVENNYIYGAYLLPDGTTVDIELLQIIEF